MRRALALAAALSALGAIACSTPCQDLGDRLCTCLPAGTSQDTCKRQVKDQLSALNPGKDVEDKCSEKLGTCNAPSGAQFCEWLQTACGKESCGLSADSDPAAGIPSACPAP